MWKAETVRANRAAGARNKELSHDRRCTRESAGELGLDKDGRCCAWQLDHERTKAGFLKRYIDQTALRCQPTCQAVVVRKWRRGFVIPNRLIGRVRLSFASVMAARRNVVQSAMLVAMQ